jgi:hypothetical protein
MDSPDHFSIGILASWQNCTCSCHSRHNDTGFRGAHCEKCEPTSESIEAAKTVEAVEAVETVIALKYGKKVVEAVEAVETVDFTKLSIKAEANPILDHARAVLAGKPPRSYVESALALAQYILDHQLALAGWVCPSCKVFNGEEKEIFVTCRSCMAKRLDTGAPFPRRVDHVG